MIIERDVEITADDGIVLRADVFRPESGQVPVIMTLGPYGKGVEYKTGYAPQWNWLVETYPNILPGSTRSFMCWETVDPEIWVPWGYACIRVDSRGTGRSPGVLDMFSPREVKDYYDAIEWAGVQPWSNGKVGLNGISYYAINQWLVASLQPPHLEALIPWEGAADFYRDLARHGGIFSNAFLETWYPRQVLSNQHGNSGGHSDPWLKARATGPATYTKEELETNRNDPVPAILNRPLDGPFYRDRSPDWSKVTVPFLSAANWAGFGLHPRGNFEAFTQAASTQKWLEGHPGRHEEWFYLNEPMQMQKRFLDHFLKGEDNGWNQEPPVLLHLRRPFTEATILRKEQDWPLARTQWTKAYLNASSKTISWNKPSESSSISFKAMEESITFHSAPLESETEITGPLALRVFVSSSTEDADMFVVFMAFSSEGKEVEFQGTVDPHTPLAQGWLRASHRKLDVARTKPFRPYHAHDEKQPLQPSTVYQLDIEIWPTCIILPAGFRFALQIRGTDFARESPPEKPNEAWVANGSGPWLHTHLLDRPSNLFSGTTTVYSNNDNPSYLLLPIIKN